MATAIEIGVGATLCVGSDRYPYFVSGVTPSGKTVYAIQAEFKGAPGHNYYGDQKWEITPRPDGKPEAFTLRKNGRYVRKGDQSSTLHIGKAIAYQDPSF